MDKFNINNKKQYFAFNLTHNQSTDEESYNENIIWLENKTSLLILSLFFLKKIVKM